MKNKYDPFDKPWDETTVEDLVNLRIIHEGWYVEYKQEIPKAYAIAKSVSAFANTFGGYLFYGVEEQSKEHNIAGSFPGIASIDVPAMRERIRQAIAAHSAPNPYFHIKSFPGPCEQLGLDKDRSIIGIYIPQSTKAPHIHKSGVIYRRVADSSEPTPENDRHALGELFKRSDALLDKYKSWYDADPKFLKEEDGHPYLRLLFVSDPWRERKPWLGLPGAEVRKVFMPDDTNVTLPFDTIHSTRDGFVARQTIGNRLDSMPLTWALRRDLTSEVLIPIPAVGVQGDEALKIDLEGYEQESRFVSLIEKRLHRNLRVLDLNQLLFILNGIFETLERISSAADWKHGTAATFKILNADRCCPFIDSEYVMEKFEQHGIPIVLSFMSSLVEHYHPENFLRFECKNDEGNNVPPEVNAAILMMHVAWSFGLPMWEGKEDLDLDLFEQLRSAGARSMNAQALRNAKSKTFAQ